MNRILTSCLASACAVAMWPATVAATEPVTWVVDDDGVQCGNRDFSSIAGAVTAATAGDTIRICAGMYRERVVVEKPLHLVGQREPVEAVECFDPVWSTGAPVDPAVFAVVAPPDDEIGSLLRLRADGIEVAGLVVQGQRQDAPTSTDPNLYDPAVDADGAYSGHRIHHNIVQSNTLGIELGSNGAMPSRVDHNCLRGNGWDLANQRYTATAIRVDHNETFRTGTMAFEIGSYVAPVVAARVDHNHSVGSGFATYYVERTASVVLEHNRVEGAAVYGIFVRGENDGLELSANELTGAPSTGAGIGLVAPTVQAPTPSTDVVIRGNTVVGFGTGIGLAPNARTSGVHISENATQGNRVNGILLGATNTTAIVHGNTSDSNGRFGIRVNPGATGNHFVGNSMHFNADKDASDANVTVVDGVTTLGNTWTDNHCDTDAPEGLLCVAN